VQSEAGPHSDSLAAVPVRPGARSGCYGAVGNRMKATVNGVTTLYVGKCYELSGSTTRTYYYLGGCAWICGTAPGTTSSSPTTWAARPSPPPAQGRGPRSFAKEPGRRPASHPATRTRRTASPASGRRVQSDSTSIMPGGTTRRWAASPRRIQSCPSRGTRRR
jgi:hypothetical protein